jgi:Holliday junction resolvase RusA-like endonuclease
VEEEERMSAKLTARQAKGPDPLAGVNRSSAFVISVPGLPPSLNDLTRRKLRDRMRLGKRWRHDVAICCLAAQIPPAKGKRRVSLHVTYGPGVRQRDIDAYWKATLDALTHAKAILGDRYHEAAIGDLVHERGTANETRIILEDVGAGWLERRRKG